MHGFQGPSARIADHSFPVLFPVLNAIQSLDPVELIGGSAMRLNDSVKIIQ